VQDGDVFSIGKFEFQVHVPQPLAALQTVVRPQIPAPESAAKLSELSASELVALIEFEEQQVAELEQGRINGARALLDAVQRVAATAPVDASSSGEFVISFPQSAAAANVEQSATDDAVALAARRAS